MSDIGGLPLFAPERYPSAPGWKREGTSREAAEKVDAVTLRRKVMDEFRRRGPMTADEVAQAVLPHATLDRALFSIRPRVSELHKLGKLMDTGTRRPNASQRSAIVWKIP